MGIRNFFDKAVLNRGLYDRVIKKVLHINDEICERLDHMRPWPEIAEGFITDKDITKVHRKWGGDTAIDRVDFGDHIKTFMLDEHICNITYYCAREYSEREATVPMAQLYAESSMVNLASKMMCIPKPSLSRMKNHMDQMSVNTNREHIGEIITNFAKKVPSGQELPLAYTLNKSGFAPYILNVTKPKYVFAFLSYLAENVERQGDFDKILRQTKLLEAVAPLPAIKDCFYGVSTYSDLRPNPELWEIVSPHCRGDESNTFAHHHSNI